MIVNASDDAALLPPPNVADDTTLLRCALLCTGLSLLVMPEQPVPLVFPPNTSMLEHAAVVPALPVSRASSSIRPPRFRVALDWLCFGHVVAIDARPLGECRSLLSVCDDFLVMVDLATWARPWHQCCTRFSR